MSGSQQALDLTGRLLLNLDDTFVIENPAYALARKALEATGARAIPVNVDCDGLETSLLDGVNARLAYVTPSHQYPLGSIMSAERRLELIGWFRKFGAWIVEDDYDSEYRYDIKPLPPLQAIGDNSRVIYIGTVSKILSPALRIGCVVVLESLKPAFMTAKQLADRHTSLNDQEALADFIESGAYERHVRRQRNKNSQRLEVLIEALHLNFGSRIEIESTKAGLHVVVWIKDLPRTCEPELIERARSLGLYSVHSLYNPPCPGERGNQVDLVMGYAALSPESITKASPPRSGRPQRHVRWRSGTSAAMPCRRRALIRETGDEPHAVVIRK
ncbi:PLP-dependent aminotransferase family protein [Breoghania sp.]|uniref:aminotransferase-like domain-containing protein n=1 Tax=Breoghania sp. TaxID=2065378 RepID=UPI0026305FE4|nr:PLP-dependent aminotransferase family protein [Breoghania sp.]MDJ0930701.1 PLP-dependent aminotransferase family protein [Breoghania sp.]